jgi:glycosyltransferase involved in cell wall biosynthesis
MTSLADENRVKVSVLMPLYNAADTLRECVDSILRQSLPDFEIIVVDDFSDDASIDILRSYCDERIRIVENTAKGIVSALNHGLQCCRSDYVARMDADDIMSEYRLEKQLAMMLADDSITLCASQVRKFPQEIIQPGYIEYMRWQNACLSAADIANEIYIESPFAHPSVMFRKHRLLELGAYQNGDFPEDYELWLRLFHSGHKMIKLEEVLLHWRESETRLSRNDERYSLPAFEKLRAEYLAKDPRLNGRKIVFWGAGRKTRQRAQYLIGHGVKPVAWIDINTAIIGNTYHGAKTCPPEYLMKPERLHALFKTHNKKPFVLNYVRNHGARLACRQFLDSAGYIRGKDYLDMA